jgi:hypothetical protein|tara:strand:- start:370 stop:687 length:318 start_codon:yes stop_codon:yes gene_type:complete
MRVNKKKPPVSDGTKGANKKNILTKHNTIMRILYQRPLHRFQAEVEGDHCLPSTISSLKKQHGLEFPRRWIKVPNRFGGETSVMEYSTSEEDKRKIIDEILGVVE